MSIRIPGYQVIRELGEGGMCVVYLARHEAFEELVAVKVLHEQYSHQEDMRQRFLNEARIMRGLKHEHIVDVRDFLTFDSRVALVMDYIDGKTLNHVIGRETGPIPHEKALPLFRQILEAVGHAHSQGVVHRDLKPSNILVTASGQAKVTDFGIAKVMGSGGMTRTGTKLGTLYYMSPEQVRGAKDVDHRSDIYSLGMTLYEMLAGRLPFDKIEDTSEFEITQKIVFQELEPPDAYYPHIPEWLVRVVEKAMAKDPADRFQSCGEFLEALEERPAEPYPSQVMPGSAPAPLPDPKPQEPVPTAVIDELVEQRSTVKKNTSVRGHGERKSTTWIWIVALMAFAAMVAMIRRPWAGGSAAAEVSVAVEATERFTRSGSIITDHETDLEWRVGPDSSTDWYEADSWARGLGGDWRLPTRAELQELYDAGIRYEDWGPFENGGSFVWSGEVRDSSSAWGVAFYAGSEGWATRDNDYYLRAFAVRPRG